MMDSNSVLESTKEFSKYQRSMLNHISYCGLSRHIILKTKGNTSCSYRIHDATKFAKFLTYFILLNSLIKVGYILYLCGTKFMDMDFLDKITLALYYLFFGIMSLPIRIWSQIYPFYEILYGTWSVEHAIYEKLGSPLELKEAVQREQRNTVFIHLLITYVGCVCFLIQYYADAKYYTFLYSSVEGENLLLWIIFGIHEFIFMQHCWFTMISCSSCFTFRASALAHFLQYMTKTIYKLSEAMESRHLKGTIKGSDSLSEVIAPGTQYHIHRLLFDYKLLMFITEQYNSYISYKIVALHACGYLQFISDVFLAVQVLRIPGTSVFDIWFYVEDSIVSMYMIYRVYTFMAQTTTESAKLFQAIKVYLSYPNRERKRLQKVIRTLRFVSLRLGPCPVTPGVVLAAMDMLSGYYICVALWK